MTRRSVELSRLAFVLFVRGVFLIILGAGAIRWPEQTLLLGIVAAGGVVGTLGIFEVAAASISETLPSTKLFLLAHGLVSILFGALTATIPVASASTAAKLSVAFMVLYAAYAFTLAARLQFVRRARNTLRAWGTFNVFGVTLLAVARPDTTNQVLYAGALYGAVLGALQLAAALWIRRGETIVDRLEHAVPVPARR